MKPKPPCHWCNRPRKHRHVAAGKPVCAAHWARHRKGQDMAAPVQPYARIPGFACHWCGREMLSRYCVEGRTACEAHYRRYRKGYRMDAPIRTECIPKGKRPRAGR